MEVLQNGRRKKPTPKKHNRAIARGNKHRAYAGYISAFIWREFG